jgi:hypothetical protein
LHRTLGFGDDQRTNPIRRDQQYFDIIICIRIDQCDATGELSDLAGPRTCRVPALLP